MWPTATVVHFWISTRAVLFLVRTQQIEIFLTICLYAGRLRQKCWQGPCAIWIHVSYSYERYTLKRIGDGLGVLVLYVLKIQRDVHMRHICVWPYSNTCVYAYACTFRYAFKYTDIASKCTFTRIFMCIPIPVRLRYMYPRRLTCIYMSTYTCAFGLPILKPIRVSIPIPRPVARPIPYICKHTHAYTYHVRVPIRIHVHLPMHIHVHPHSPWEDASSLNDCLNCFHTLLIAAWHLTHIYIYTYMYMFVYIYIRTHIKER